MRDGVRNTYVIYFPTSPVKLKLYRDATSLSPLSGYCAFKNAPAKPLWTLLAGIVLNCIPVASVCDLPQCANTSHTVR